MQCWNLQDKCKYIIRLVHLPLFVMLHFSIFFKTSFFFLLYSLEKTFYTNPLLMFDLYKSSEAMIKSHLTLSYLFPHRPFCPESWTLHSYTKSWIASLRCPSRPVLPTSGYRAARLAEVGLGK